MYVMSHTADSTTCGRKKEEEIIIHILKEKKNVHLSVLHFSVVYRYQGG